MTARSATWILFTAFGAALPCLYYVLVGGGLVPLFFLCLALPFQARFEPFLAGVTLVHCVVYTAVWYGVARAFGRRIVSLPTPRTRRLTLAGAVVLSGAIGLLPIYGVFAHGDPGLTSAFGMYAQLFGDR